MNEIGHSTNMAAQQAGWKRTALRAAARADEQFDALRRRLHGRLGVGDPYTICAYMGYATADGKVRLRGRVLAGPPAPPPLDSDSVWTNLLATYRRLESDEVAGARVEISLGGVVVEAVTDSEGYYDVEFTPVEKIASPWQTGRVRLLEPAAKPQVDAPVSALSARTADFAVISDIDDTILISDATHLVRAARRLFLQNARSRLTFPGVAQFYAALQRGVSPASFNPIFYVSASPWNLYELLTDFMEFQGIPAGPLFLRDYGLAAPETDVPFDTTGHKLLYIEKLLADLPHLPFVLIGDSGQRDPEIYAHMAARHMDRIRAIYIRDIAPNQSDGRESEVARLSRETSVNGIPILLVDDTTAAHGHAARIGLVAAQAQPPAGPAHAQDADTAR